jgi:predicted dithiol-disulfide oxidoreductase (DUF899 family)
MDRPQVVSRGEWLVARKELLAREKEAIRVKDAVDGHRRALPMVEVDKEYVFAGPGGRAGLLDLFDGRRQLVVYHFMWRHEESGFPGEDQGCPICSLMADNMGDLSHLHASDTTLVLVSRAPLASIERFRQRMGWPVPWYSSLGSDFNYHFHVSFDEDVAPIEYNYKDKAALVRDVPYIRSGADAHGLSVFLRDGDRVFHTYSTYGRGVDQLIGTYQYLDMTPLGRQRHVTGFSYHDKYEDAS